MSNLTRIFSFQKSGIHLNASFKFQPPITEGLEWDDFFPSFLGIRLCETCQKIERISDDPLSEYFGDGLFLLWRLTRKRCGRVQTVPWGIESSDLCSNTLGGFN